MEEKRRFVRLSTNVKVKLVKIGEMPKDIQDSPEDSRNISENGICIIMHGDAVKVGDKLHLGIELPTKKIIKLEGIAMWVNEFEIFGGKHERRFDVGIKFLKIRNKDKDIIKDFVSASLRQKAINQKESL